MKNLFLTSLLTLTMLTLFSCSSEKEETTGNVTENATTTDTTSTVTVKDSIKLEEKKKYVEELIDGTNREIIVRNLDTIKDDLLLEELIQYNDKGNFDRVSAFLLLMLWIEQDKELVIKETENIVKKSSLDFYQELHNNRLKNKLLINY